MARWLPPPARYLVDIVSVLLQVAGGQWPEFVLAPQDTPGFDKAWDYDNEAGELQFAIPVEKTQIIRNQQMKKKRLEMECESWKGAKATDENARKSLQKDK